MVSYFHNWPAALSSSVILTAVKSGFIEVGITLCFKNFRKVGGTVCDDIQLQNHIKCVFAENVFSPTLLKLFIVVLVEVDNKLIWFVQVSLLLYIGMMRFKYSQQEFVFLRQFEVTPRLVTVEEIWIAYR